MNPPIDAKRKSSMRFETLNLFWARGTTEGNLGLVEIVVWLCMWTHADPHGLVIISYGKVAGECNMSRRSAANAVNSLQAKRMIKIKVRGTVDGKPSTYVLNPYPKERKGAPL